jgi:hypothetical protein
VGPVGVVRRFSLHGSDGIGGALLLGSRGVRMFGGSLHGGAPRVGGLHSTESKNNCQSSSCACVCVFFCFFLLGLQIDLAVISRPR